MQLYLSSYRLGNHAQSLKELVSKTNAKVAVSVNALDNTDASVRNDTVLKRELEDMRSLSYEPEELDLRDFFCKEGLLEKNEPIRPRLV